MSELIECADGLTANDIIRSVAKTANGLPWYLQTYGLGGFCDEYQAVYDALTTPPSEAIAAQQEIMCCGLVDDGVWAKFDLFYLFAQTTNGAGEALVNWVNPGTYDATLSVVPPTFTALEGLQGGYNQTRYILPGVAPNALGNYAQNSASMGIYIRNNSGETAYPFGIFGIHDAFLIARWSTDIAIGRLNANAAGNVANTDSRGMWIINRVLSSHQDTYRNKVRIINDAAASTGVPVDDILVLTRNNAGAAHAPSSSYQASVFFAGGGLTQIDIDNITDRVETYMDSNGKGVIP